MIKFELEEGVSSVVVFVVCHFTHLFAHMMDIVNVWPVFCEDLWICST